jgi:hypothetical protein
MPAATRPEMCAMSASSTALCLSAAQEKGDTRCRAEKCELAGGHGEAYLLVCYMEGFHQGAAGDAICRHMARQRLQRAAGPRRPPQPCPPATARMRG